MDHAPDDPVQDWAQTICLDHPLEYKCVLYNDEVHAMDEVVRQLLKALGAAVPAAVALMLRVHHEGQAVVFSGPLEQCRRCAAVLDEIGLETGIYL